MRVKYSSSLSDGFRIPPVMFAPSLLSVSATMKAL